LIAESTSTGTITAEYAYLNGQPLTKIENNNVYYYHNDHLGTPIVITDSSGSTVWQGEFNPFGEPLSVSGSITNNLRFPGQYYDEETGLNQNWRRDYNSEIGRYVEADPIGNTLGRNKSYRKMCGKNTTTGTTLDQVQELNIYIYALNNPMNKIDPYGLSVQTVNCSAMDSVRIQIAAAKADAASQSCLPCKDRKPFRRNIRNLTVNCTASNVSPSGSTVCGYTYGGNSIYLTPAGISGVTGCGCLQATILHEVTHNIGYNEPQARAAERKCFSCT